jgi:hypothetical protein
MASRLTGIVLQGGGAFGAYEHGVLKALYDTRGPGFVPAVVTGVSIGAINAAAVAAGKRGAVATLRALWAQFQAPDVPLLPGVVESLLGAYGLSGMYRVHPEGWLAPWLVPWLRPGCLSPAPLGRTLEKHLDLDRLNGNHLPWTAITAADVATGELVVFDSIHGPPIDVDAIVAAASLPMAFGPQPVGGRYCYDGGLISNTPFSEALNRLEELAVHDPRAELELIVIELFPHKAAVPRDVYDATDRAFELLLAARHQLEEKLIDKVNLVIDLVDAVKREHPDTRVFDGGRFIDLEMHRKVDIKRLEYTAPEAALGPFDFSKAALRRRFEAGYGDGLAAFGSEAGPASRPPAPPSSGRPSKSAPRPERAGKRRAPKLPRPLIGGRRARQGKTPARSR